MDAGRHSILVVEDEALIALPIQRSLEKLGYAVELAGSGPEAIRLAANAPPDLVLMDIMLGGEIDGILAAGEIRRLHEIPIVYLTAYADDATVARAKQTEPFGYLVKPFREKELHTTVAIAIHRHRVEMERQERELWFSSVLSSVGDGVVTCDLEGIVTSLNPVASALTGRSARDAMGQPLLSVIEVSHESGAAAIAEKVLPAIREGIPAELPPGSTLLTPAGAAVSVNGNLTPLKDTHGRLRGAVLVLRDITSQVHAEEQLRHNFLHDPLTGLPNRTLLMERLQHRWRLRQRDPEDLFAVLFLDLDRFKLINDSLGHLVGDRYLVEIADRLRGVVRQYDTLARLGGDEFTVLLEQLTDLRQPLAVAERIQSVLSAPIILGEHEIVCTASIGIAISSHSHRGPEDLLRDADIAMYRAKSSNASRMAIFDAEMRASVLAVVQLEKDLRQALANEELRVFYQPIVSLANGRLRSLEALVRWEHPRRGLLEPDAFLQVAEETGMIRRINRYVWQQACTQMQAWRKAYPAMANLGISLNLSSRDVLQPDLADQLMELLEATGLPVQCLQLELTERILIASQEPALTTLSRLREMGIDLHLDDFGTGYSSLNYLTRFPVAQLKIDRTFIQRIERSREDLAVVRTIISLAHELGMEVTGEGVETQEQLDLLRILNCDLGQGYLISRPVRAEDAGRLLMSGDTSFC